METALFYIFGSAILLFAVLAVSLKNLLHSALSLMACLFTTAAYFILLHAEFVALVQVMVYIGGVVIFIVYAILLTTQLGERFVLPSKLKVILGLSISAGLALFLFHLLQKSHGLNFQAENDSFWLGSAQAIGQRLLSTGPGGFIVPFEIISVLLLVALVGAISIARREKSKNPRMAPLAGEDNK